MSNRQCENVILPLVAYIGDTPATYITEIASDMCRTDPQDVQLAIHNLTVRRKLQAKNIGMYVVAEDYEIPEPDSKIVLFDDHEASINDLYDLADSYLKVKSADKNYRISLRSLLERGNI